MRSVRYQRGIFVRNSRHMQTKRQVRLSGTKGRTETRVGFHPIDPAAFPGKIRMSRKTHRFHPNRDVSRADARPGCTMRETKQSHVNIHWNHPSDRACPAPSRSNPHVAAQPELGILPERCIGPDPGHFSCPVAARKNLIPACRKHWRIHPIHSPAEYHLPP